ncbi:MAG: sigma-70 family RNA polymerase sigma factor [Acidimicrobiia bacterium]|nr:sigma-70 family RNA polymerase sigma factor [Acidimicrobiia bacterium]
MVQSPDAHEAFRRLYDEHHRAIQKYCARRLPIADANEAVAETFLVVWRKIAKVPDGKDARLWLYGVARNAIRNARRGNRRQARLTARVGSVSDVPPLQPEVQVVRRAEDRIVLDARSTLSDADQEVLALHAWEGLSAGEIAEVLGVTRNSAAMRINRATKRLGKALELAGYAAGSLDPPDSVEGDAS